MRFLTFFLGLLFLSSTLAGAESTPAAPSGELPYEELMQKAEAMLVPQGEKKTVYEGAAIVLFYRASRVAPDDGAKLEALLRAGYAQELMAQFPSAIESYTNALGLPKISAAQKTRANFALANAKFRLAKNKNSLFNEGNALRAAFEGLIAAPDLSADSRVAAQEAIAEIYAARGERLQAVQKYQELLAQPNLAPEKRAHYLTQALAEIGRSPATPQGLALTNALFPQYLATKNKPSEIADAYQWWATILIAQNDKAGAIKQLNIIADAADSELDKKVAALARVSTLHRELKNYPAALAAADRIGVLSSEPWVQSNFRDQRIAIFAAQNDEPKVRAEWLALIATPRVTPETQATSHLRIADSFKRERLALKDKSGTATLLDGEKKALDAAWNTAGARIETRQAAILELAQIEVDAKNWNAASTLLLDAFKTAETFREQEAAAFALKRNLHLALAMIYRAEKIYAKALAALIVAQGFSGWGENKAGQDAIELMKEVFAAKDWDNSRTILLALNKVWGLPQKVYLFNLAQVEVEAKNWTAAKTALDEFDKQNRTAEEIATATKLRAAIPATP